MKIDRSALAAIVLLAASFFLGAAAILVTPPFEGADETAHYSYIQQLADTGHAPVPGKDGLSRDPEAAVREKLRLKGGKRAGNMNR